MTRRQKNTLKRTVIAVAILLALLTTALVSYNAGVASRIPAAITITEDKTVLIDCENGHRYAYQPEIYADKYIEEEIAK